MNHIDEERLIAYADGDTAGIVEIVRHLDECEECRASYHSIRRVMTTAAAMAVPEPDAAFEQRMWARVRPELGPKKSSTGWHGWLAAAFAPRRLAFAGAMAAMVLAAFLAGRFWPHGEGLGPQPKSVQPENLAQVHERILLVAVGDHLDRAQSVLLEISNAEPGTAGAKAVDISREQRRAEDLLAANRLYRQTAQRTGDAPVASFLDELEPLLVEIANSPSQVSSSSLEELQRRIAARGLLLKVRVLSSTVREREKTTAPAQGATPAQKHL